MELHWKNPFTHTNEKILILDSAEDGDSGLRVPSSFRTSTVRWKVNADDQALEKKEYRSVLGDLEEKALDGLIAMANGGDFDSQYRLMLLLLNILELPEGFEHRRLQRNVLRDTIGKIEIFEDREHNLHSRLWAELEALTLGGQPPSEPLKMRSSEVAALQRELLAIYADVMPEEGAIKAHHLRNFRERLNRAPNWSALSPSVRALLRHEAALAHCFFFEDIARSFFTVAKDRLSGSEQILYALLHFPLEAPQEYSGLLTVLPPISALEFFPFIREAYSAAYKMDPCKELLALIDRQDPVEIEHFLQRVLAVLRWYRIYYLDAARSGDRRRGPIQDFDAHTPAVDVPEASALTQSQKVWMEKFKELSFASSSDLKSAIQEDPRPRRQTILLRLLQGRSPRAIAEDLGISRQAVEQQAKTGLRRLQRNR